MSDTFSGQKLKGTIRVGTRLVQYPSAPNHAERTFKVAAIFEFKGYTMFTLARWQPRRQRYHFTTEPEYILREFWGRPEKQGRAAPRNIIGA